MKLLTDPLRRQLLRNGIARCEANARGACCEFKPVVKLFTPDANATWLLTEIDPRDHDRAFGLCDLGLGFPELGYVSLTEIARLRGKLGLPVERDRFFRAEKALLAYAVQAAQLGHI